MVHHPIQRTLLNSSLQERSSCGRERCDCFHAACLSHSPSLVLCCHGVILLPAKMAPLWVFRSFHMFSSKSISAKVFLPQFLRTILQIRNKAVSFWFSHFIQELIQNVSDEWVLDIIFLFFILVNLEVTQSVTNFAIDSYVQPVMEIILLQIFFVRYFKYHLEVGTSEVTVILLLLLSVVMTSLPLFPAFSFTLISLLKKLLKIAASMGPSSTGWVQPRASFRTCFLFWPLLPQAF